MQHKWQRSGILPPFLDTAKVLHKPETAFGRKVGSTESKRLRLLGKMGQPAPVWPCRFAFTVYFIEHRGAVGQFTVCRRAFRRASVLVPFLGPAYFSDFGPLFPPRPRDDRKGPHTDGRKSDWDRGTLSDVIRISFQEQYRPCANATRREA